VILKNGQVIIGKIVNQTKTEIHINVKGKVQIIPKSKVLEVDFRSTEPVQKPSPQPVKKPEPKPEPKKAPEKTEEIISETIVEVEKEEEKESRPLNQYDLLWRSAVPPGWGQYKVKKKLWAFTEGPFSFFYTFLCIRRKEKSSGRKSKV